MFLLCCSWFILLLYYIILCRETQPTKQLSTELVSSHIFVVMPNDWQAEAF